MPRVQHELVSVGGARLWTETVGEGPPVAWCHGGPGGYDDLRPLADMVADVACVHRFDQRGGGRSSRVRPPGLDTLVEDIEALRRHWGHERWTVGGNSWGAHLALFYALAHRDRTRGLILLSTTGVRWGSWFGPRRARRLQRLAAEERAEAIDLERRLAEREDDAALARLRELWWTADFADPACAARARPLTAFAADRDVVSTLERDWERGLDGIDERLRTLATPALVLHGSEDPLPAEGPRHLAEQLPAARFVTLPGVGHLPWLERPADLGSRLRAFLAALPAPAEPSPA